MSHAVCGGPSEARPGFNNAVVNTAAGIQSLITPLVPLGVAAVIASTLTQRTYQLTTFCANDPPPDPGITPNDYLALLNPADLNDFLIARDKFWQWWDHIFWYEACQCTSATTPVRPPVSSPGPGSENPGLDPGGAPCGPLNVVFETKSFDSSGNVQWDWQLPTVVNPGATWFQFTTNGGVFTTPSPYPVTNTLRFENAAGTTVFGQFQWISRGPVPASTPETYTTAVPAGATNIRLVSHTDSAPSTGFGIDVHLTQFCSAAPGIPCCPPDPATQWQLNTIIQILANLNVGSGSSAPTSWRDGTRHTALTGSGRLVLSANVVGARVEVTAVPPTIASHPGNPAFYFDLGFITPIAIDVPLRGQRLVFNPQSFALPQFADGIAWTLPTGAQINLVELLPVA